MTYKLMQTETLLVRHLTPESRQWKNNGGDLGSSAMSAVREDRWRCGTAKQLEVNLCRVEIAELRAAIRSISYFSSTGDPQ